MTKKSVVFIDFTKAFDLVGHKIYLLKWKGGGGIRSIVLSWFISYLVGSFQQVKIRNRLNEPKVVKKGSTPRDGPFCIFVSYVQLHGDISVFSDPLL